MYMLLLQRYRFHRELHSFPTRRSSDLGHEGNLGILADEAGIRLALGRSMKHLGAVVTRPATGKRKGRNRSEEHTSELQSHVNLVCRLLLETKNAPSVTSHAPATTSAYP